MSRAMGQTPFARDHVVHLEIATNVCKICANFVEIFVVCSIFEFNVAPPRETLRFLGNKINCFPRDHSLNV